MASYGVNILSALLFNRRFTVKMFYLCDTLVYYAIKYWDARPFIPEKNARYILKYCLEKKVKSGKV